MPSTDDEPTAPEVSLEVMASNYPYGPRRSDPERPSSSGATPRRAAPQGAPEPPITSGYSYNPARAIQEQPQPTPAYASQPLLPTGAPTDSISNYRPRTSPWWYVGLIALVVVAIIGAIVIYTMPEPSGTPSPTATTPGYPAPTETRTGGIPFESGSTTGYWRVTSSSWKGNTVTMTIEVDVDKGNLYFDCYVYGNNDMKSVNHDNGANNLALPAYVTSGTPLIGTLTFTLTRQPLTLIMADLKTQISALPVPG